MLNQIKSIPDGTSATIQIHTESGEPLQLNCVFKEDVAPCFGVVVPPGRLVESIDQTKPCLMTVLLDEERPFVFTASIRKITSDRSLSLIASDEIDPTSLREYFRVSIALPIKVSAVIDAKPQADDNWSLVGETLDLSGSGSLVVFPGECRARTKVQIELDLGHPQQRVACQGHVVRIKRLRGGRWQTALHFDTISPRVRDAIITACFHEQRRRLRGCVKIS